MIWSLVSYHFTLMQFHFRVLNAVISELGLGISGCLPVVISAFNHSLTCSPVMISIQGRDWIGTLWTEALNEAWRTQWDILRHAHIWLWESTKTGVCCYVGMMSCLLCLKFLEYLWQLLPSTSDSCILVFGTSRPDPAESTSFADVIAIPLTYCSLPLEDRCSSLVNARCHCSETLSCHDW